MIDLNYKQNDKQSTKDETPLGVVILGMFPFAALFAWIILSGI